MRGGRSGAGSPGDSASSVIIPVGNQFGSTTRIFPHLLDAISQVQQFHVIEVTGQEIPSDFLTLRGVLNFFNVGFGSGLLEGLVFMLLMALTFPLEVDRGLEALVSRWFPMVGSSVFLWVVDLSPMIIAACLCSYLSRYYEGEISKKAINALLVGRLSSLFLHAMLIFVGLIMLSHVITPASAWRAAEFVSLHHNALAVRIYNITMELKPVLIRRAFQVSLALMLAVSMPFITIWFVSWFKKIKMARDRARWMK